MSVIMSKDTAYDRPMRTSLAQREYSQPILFVFKYRNATSININNLPYIDNPLCKTILPHIKTTLRLKQFKIMSSSNTSTNTIM